MAHRRSGEPALIQEAECAEVPGCGVKTQITRDDEAFGLADRLRRGSGPMKTMAGQFIHGRDMAHLVFDPPGRSKEVQIAGDIESHILGSGFGGAVYRSLHGIIATRGGQIADDETRLLLDSEGAV